MLFLISSAPDAKEFQSAYKLAKGMGADICLLQNAVYAARQTKDNKIYVLADDMRLRGIAETEIAGRVIDYSRLMDMMAEADKVVGMF